MSNVQRTPIIGLREPIVGIRVAIHLREPLDWDAQYKKFDNYIKFASKQVSESVQNCFYGADDLYQEGLLIMWQCFDRYQYKSEEEFQYLFKSSLWRHLREKVKKPNLETTDVDELYESEDIGYTEDNLDDIYEEYRMKQVRELLAGNPTALSILRELLSQSKGTVDECTKDRSRKEMIKSQGITCSLSASVEVTALHIQRALKLSKEVYAENFKLVQGAVYEVYSRDTEIKNYMPDTNWFYDTLDSKGVLTDVPALTDEEVDTLVEEIEPDVDDIVSNDSESVKTA